MGASRVLFDYVFDGPEKIDLFCRHLPSTIPVHVFTLWAPIDRIIHREATREGRERMGKAVVTTFETLERNLHALGHVISNMETPEAAAQTIADEIAHRGDWISKPYLGA